MGNPGCGKHGGTNSVYCPSYNAVHENMGFVVWPVFKLHPWFKIFSHYIITDAAAPTNWCRNLIAVLRLPRVHPVCCWWCWPKLKFTECPEWVILQTFYQLGPHPGQSCTKLWKWMSYKLLTTFRSSISLHFLWGQTHRDIKCWSPILHWPQSIRS